MSDENSERKKNTISLAELNPADYRIWVSSAEATFAVYNSFGVTHPIQPLNQTQTVLSPQLHLLYEDKTNLGQLVMALLAKPSSNLSIDLN